MKKVILYISLALIIFTSCSFIVPYRIKRDFNYCFDGEKTGLDTLININGYYAPDSIIRPSDYIFREGKYIPPKVKDTLMPNYLFYDNGFGFMNLCMEDYIRNKKMAFLYKRWQGRPGGYRIYGDTIKLQCVDGPGGQSREMVEIWFKIIDRNTIGRIPVGDNPLQPFVDIYIFRPLEMRPNPEDSWIYKKRWFRCKKK